jgi:hypothetical protein
MLTVSLFMKFPVIHYRGISRGGCEGVMEARLEQGECLFGVWIAVWRCFWGRRDVGRRTTIIYWRLDCVSY